MYTEIRLEKINDNLSVKLCEDKPFYYEENVTVVESAHIHDCYEIYINITGDVSFLVESTLYKLKNGDIIITKPNEMHHCIYNYDGIQSCHCLWVDINDGCDDIKKLFSERERGENNHISLSSEDRKALLWHVERLYQLSKNKETHTSSFLANMYSVFSLLCKHKNQPEESAAPDMLTKIMIYIDENISAIRNAEDLETHFFISRSSLYRIFEKQLKMTPAQYIKNKRLSLAKKLLTEKHSVKEVCEECGFNDYSHFISVFRKKFDVTPHRFLKSISK
ncbi:MAG: helix-turn-helix domain-containing protein [Clostridia bacterium]|nr:helix-turn-helix domain-containing protein [Clostridia bacterium]